MRIYASREVELNRTKVFRSESYVPSGPGSCMAALRHHINCHYYCYYYCMDSWSQL